MAFLGPLSPSSYVRQCNSTPKESFVIPVRERRGQRRSRRRMRDRVLLAGTSALRWSTCIAPRQQGRWLSSSTSAGGDESTGGAFLPHAGTRQQTILYNSLTKTKEPLPRGQTLTWYTCGPTVYDHAHIGHARAYVALDIVRRVLTQQGYSVFQVMGMTDIDDKIIAKAKERGLSGVQGVAEVSRQFEYEFLRDMAAMNVQPPDTITRVTDYLPEIVQFVGELESKGFAYRGAKTGSLWFDTVAYGSRYGALEPSRGFGCANPSHADIAAVDAEAAEGGEKKNFRDFALWKPVPDTAEAGWDSALGRGRPGWHIECSAFCRAMFGDVSPAPFLHSGGRDLRFPHHENEIAQSQALFNTDRWVQHWLHAGQLTVEGLKMSKSLKNYTSIQTYLAGSSPRLFRIFCLLHKYSADVSFGADRMADAMAWERAFAAYFRANDVYITSRYAAYEQQGPCSGDSLRWDEPLGEVHSIFLACQLKVQAALHDDIDTRSAMNHLRQLTSAVSRYLQQVAVDAPPPQAAWPLLSNVAFYVRNTLESWYARGKLEGRVRAVAPGLHHGSVLVGEAGGDLLGKGRREADLYVQGRGLFRLGEACGRRQG